MPPNTVYKKVFDHCKKESVIEEFKNSREGSDLTECASFRQKIEVILTNLACKDFSFAIHCVTGWEVIEYGLEGNDFTNHWYHSVCKVPDSDLFLDAKGIRTEAEILSEYPAAKAGESIYAVDVDPEPSHFCDTKPLELLASFLIGRDNAKLAKNM